MKNRFLDTFDSIVVLSVKTNNINRFLSHLYNLNISIFNINIKSYNCVLIEIYEYDLDKLKMLKINNEINIIKYKGRRKRKNFFVFNKTLLLSLVIGFSILIFLTNIIFSIDIMHSSKKMRDYVMAELNKNGIHLYQFKKSFNELEKIKNKILNDNKDKIEWLEINRVGTKYIIKLEERKINNLESNDSLNDIVASNDAIIKKIVVENGVRVKDVNDYVKSGETIISGSIYLNDELKTTVNALGEVYGEVWYKLSIEYPIANDIKEETGNKYNTYSFNFFNKSFLFKKNKYKYSYVKKEKILYNPILPIGFSNDTVYELKQITGIYTEAEALLNAKDYAKSKINTFLKKDEYIIGSKVLNYNLNSNTIYMDIFYKVYKNIGVAKKIEE